MKRQHCTFYIKNRFDTNEKRARLLLESYTKTNLIKMDHAPWRFRFLAELFCVCYPFLVFLWLPTSLSNVILDKNLLYYFQIGNHDISCIEISSYFKLCFICLKILQKPDLGFF